jgi:hypothetical protein
MGLTRALITGRHSVTRVAFRYVAGRPLDGKPRTTSRFLAPGDRALTHTGHASRWAYLPGWQRSAWRLGVPAGTAAAVTAAVTHPLATEVVGGPTAAAGVAYVSVRTVRAYRIRHHTSEYVRPLAAVLAGQLGLPPNTPAGDLVSVPLDFRDPDYSTDSDDRLAGALPSGTIRVNLPAITPDLPDLQRAVLRSVAAKLGLDAADMDARWHMRGSEPYATFRRAPRPPKRVAFADVRAAFGADTSGAPVLGIGAREKVIRVDLDSDAPHLALSMGSGAGKSVLLRAVIAQFLHNGAQVIIADGKRISQSWCKNLAGVSYYRTGEQMHDALIALQAEVDRRNDLIDAVDAEDEDSVDVGPRIVFVFEEQNVGVPMLVKYWNKAKQKGDPKRSPALDALDFILCTGRQVKVHVVSVAQMFTVAAAGGNPAARENYGLRGLGRATRNAWLMLAPEVGPPFPRSSRIRGRIHVVLAGEATECQCVFMTVPEAREWATSGPVTVPVTWSAPTKFTVRPAESTVTPESVTADEPRRFTLAQASREAWCTIDYATMRQRKRRAGAAWPAGQRNGSRETWTEAELRAAFGLDDQADATDPAAPAGAST